MPVSIIVHMYTFPSLPQGSDQSPNSAGRNRSRSRIFKKPWKRRRKPTDQDEGEQPQLSREKDILSSSSDGEEEGYQPSLDGSGFEVVTHRTALEAEQAVDTELLKRSTFNWTSHRCLREGLQGVTLKTHRTQSRIFLCGGATGTGQPNINVFYCPRRNITRWAKVANAPQYYCASVVLRRELVLVSGISTASNRCTKQLSTYDFVGNSWLEKLPPIPTPRSSAAAAVWGDYLFVMGGIDDSGRLLDTIEVLHLSQQQWMSVFHLPIPLAGATAITYKSRIILFCGMGIEGLSKRVYSFAPDRLLSSSGLLARLTVSPSSIWRQHQDTPYTVMAFCIFSNHLLGFGGIEKTSSISEPAQWVWKFNLPVDEEANPPQSNNWALVTKMHTARKLCSAVAISSTALAVIGGNPYYSVLDIAEVTPPPQGR